MSSLQPWFDPLVSVTGDAPEVIALRERIRLVQSGLLAREVWSMKRRLGSDTTPEDSSIDKQIGRRVENCELKYASDWGDQPIQAVDCRVEAAQMVWKDWLFQTLVIIQRRKIRIATWAIRHDHEKEGRQFLNRLFQEERDLVRIRDLYYPLV